MSNAISGTDPSKFCYWESAVLDSELPCNLEIMKSNIM
jgi:hypothetical protein